MYLNYVKIEIIMFHFTVDFGQLEDLENYLGYEAKAAMRHFQKLMRKAAEENGRSKVEAIINAKLSSRNYYSHDRNSGGEYHHRGENINKNVEMYALRENKATRNGTIAVESTSKPHQATTIPLERYLSARKSLLSIYRNKYHRDDSYLESYLVKRWDHENDLFDQQCNGFKNGESGGACELGSIVGGSVSTAVTTTENPVLTGMNTAIDVSTTSNGIDIFGVDDGGDDIRIDFSDEKEKFKDSFSG